MGSRCESIVVPAIPFNSLAMDAFPEELVVHVLSFLDGKDVLLSKLLNSRFGNLITKYRSAFHSPLFSVEIEDSTNRRVSESPLEIVYIHLEAKWSCAVDCSKGTVITPMNKTSCEMEYRSVNCFRFHGDSTKSANEFFRPFYEDTSRRHNIIGVFQYIFEKIDVKQLKLYKLRSELCFSVLSHVINITRTKIQEICIYPFASPFDWYEQRSLLKTIANKRPGYTKLTFGMTSPWRTIVELNDIASTYKKSLAADFSFNKLLRKWKENPIDHFHFDVGMKAVDNPKPLELDEIQDKFDVIQKNGENLCTYSMGDEETSVEFVDRESGNSLTFKKERIVLELDKKGNEHRRVELSIRALLI